MMRLLLILFVFISVNSVAQEVQQDQNLYAHVEGIMKKEFDFECDKSCHEEKSIKKSKARSGKQNKDMICHAQSTMVHHPLVVLDGRPVKNDTLRSYTVAQVQSIETLKGANATAIYGQRGSMGVLLITLKE